MLKFGIVESVNPPHVKVKFADTDSIDSYSLAVIMPFTLDDKACWNLTAGTQVACLMDENSEEGVVLGAIYSEADPPPVNDLNKFHIEFKDGTVLEYDKQEHKLTADVKGVMEIKAENINIQGDLTLTGGDITADGISLKLHKHNGVQSGVSLTGAPQ